MNKINRIPLTAWLYLSIALLTMAEAFVEITWLAQFTSVLIVLFIVLEFRNIPRLQRFAGSILAAAGIAGAVASGLWDSVLPDAIARSRSFLLLFFAVAWLQFPVSSSSSLRAVRTAIVEQPSGRRFLFLSFGVHFLGSILNLAGLSLLSTVTQDQKDLHLKRRLALALMQGFTSASCWSPFYVGMIVVLVAIPGLAWGDVAPSGAILAVTIIMTGWLYDRIVVRRRAVVASAPARSALSAVEIWRAILILVLLISSVMGLLEIVGVSIPVALGLIAVPFSIFWIILIDFQPHATRHRAVELSTKVIHGLPSLRNETLVFVAANIFGLGVASAVPTADLGNVVNQLIPLADVRIFLIFATFVIGGFLGLHPVIVVLFISSVLTPDALGLRDWIVGIVYLGCWGLCTMISPFSGTTLFMSRQTGTPAHVIAWRWASATTSVQAFALFLVIIAIRHATL